MRIKLRYKIYLVVGILGTVYLFGRCQRPLRSGGTSTSGPNRDVPAVLPKEDNEQIIIDPVKHQLIELKKDTKTVTLTLPDRRSTIDILKDGTVKVTSPQFGLEHTPFAGVFYSNALRYGAGVDGLYFKKLDLGLGAAGGSGCSTVGLVSLTYVVYDNLRSGITYDTSGHLGLGLTIRI